MVQLNSVRVRQIKRILLVILGSFILGLGNGLFLVPYNIVCGGISGIALIISANTPLSASLMITILTWAFFLLGWITLGTKFAAKTIISSIVYPLSVMLGTFLFNNTMLNLGDPLTSYGTVTYLLAALFGGVFVGLGVSLTFLAGGSTGGVDVFILLIQKHFHIKASIPSFTIDSTIILLGFFFVNYDHFDVTLMGIMSAFCSSLMIDKIFDAERNVVVTIISKKYAEINEIILEKIERGSTLIDAVGGYTDQEVKMIQVVMDIREYSILQDIIAKIDPKAFVYMTKASSVRGEGFKEHVIPKSLTNKGRKKK